jgi:predicted Zn-dependent peptidase
MTLHRIAALAAALALALPAAAAEGVKLPDHRTVKLGNGATLLLMERHDVPMVSLDLIVRGGALGDAAGKEGSAALLAELVTKGAAGRDGTAFADAVDGVGGQLDAYAGREVFGISADFMARDLDLMIELVADALIRPRLAPEEFDKARQRAIEGLAAAKDGDPRGLVGSYGYAWLFGGHPYGRPRDGDERSLAALTLGDLAAYQRDQLGGDRLIVAVVGDFRSKVLEARLAKAFGGWRKAAAPLAAAPAPQRITGRRVLLVDKPGATQSYFWLGNVGVDRKDPELPAQDLVQTVFGGRFTSMLNTELRIKSGLSYGARASLDRYLRPGAASIMSYTKTESTVAALDLAIATLERLKAEGIAPEMLESAKAYVLGQFPPDLETAPQLADKLTELALHGLAHDDVDGYGARVRGASAEQVARAVREAFPAPADLAIVVIGDAAKVREQVAKYGPVTEMKVSDPGFAPVR